MKLLFYPVWLFDAASNNTINALLERHGVRDTSTARATLLAS